MIGNVHVGRWVVLPVIGLVEVKRVFSSNNRQVFLAKGNELIFIVKTFVLGEEDAGQVEEQIINYYKALKDLGVKVVKRIQFSREINGSNVTLIQTENFVGENLQSLILGLDSTKKKLSGKLVQTVLKDIYLPLTEARIDQGSNWLSIGLDFLDRNIACRMEEDGKSWLTVCIDLMPAKILDENDVHALEIPEPTDLIVRKLGIFRHYNLAGLLIAFWCHLTKNRPEWGMYFFSTIKRFLTSNQLDTVEAELQEYLSGVIDLKASQLKLEEIAPLIQGWNFSDILRLRALACFVACWKKQKIVESKALLNKLFDVTHFRADPLPEERMEQARFILLELVGL